jgi:hypothetical protein
MVECGLRDHAFVPISSGGSEETKAGLYCHHCGLGHDLTMTWLGPTRARFDLRVYPATGSPTISREMIQWAILSAAKTKSDMAARGVSVVEGETVIEAAPVGDGLGFFRK